MPAPKHSLKTASVVFRTLFPKDSLELRLVPTFCVYFNGEASPRYQGTNWNEMFEVALDDKLKMKLSQIKQ